MSFYIRSSSLRGGNLPRAVAVQLALTTQPSGAAAGAVLSVQPVIEIRSANGVKMTGSSDAVTVSVASGPGVLGGTTTVSAAGGVATFAGLTLSAAGTYTLLFSSSGLFGVTSVSVVVLGATQLVIITQPVGAASGSPLATQPVIEARTAGGARVPAFTGNITVSRASGTSTLSGTTTEGAIAGRGAFIDLVLTGADTDTLTFASAGLSSVTSGNVVTTASAGPPAFNSAIHTLDWQPNIDAFASYDDVIAEGIKVSNSSAGGAITYWYPNMPCFAYVPGVSAPTRYFDQNAHVFYLCIVAGNTASSGSGPTYPGLGNTVVDGGVTWKGISDCSLWPSRGHNIPEGVNQLLTDGVTGRKFLRGICEGGENPDLFPQPPAWVSGHFYSAGDRVNSGGNYFKVLTGGTSAAPAPASSNGIQTDGGGVKYYFISSQEGPGFYKLLSTGGVAGKPGHRVYVRFKIRFVARTNGELLDDTGLSFTTEHHSAKTKGLMLGSSLGGGERAQWGESYSVGGRSGKPGGVFPPVMGVSGAGATLMSFLGNTGPTPGQTQNCGQASPPYYGDQASPETWHDVAVEYETQTGVGGPIPTLPWGPLATFSAGQTIQHGGQCYHVDTGGTTASPGPTGTGTGITDGGGVVYHSVAAVNLGNTDGYTTFWIDGVKVGSCTAADIDQVIPNYQLLEPDSSPAKWCREWDVSNMYINDYLGSVLFGGDSTGPFWNYCRDTRDIQIYHVT